MFLSPKTISPSPKATPFFSVGADEVELPVGVWEMLFFCCCFCFCFLFLFLVLCFPFRFVVFVESRGIGISFLKLYCEFVD
jgi:hypothetical protein